ncbi:MAG: response regulator [Terriglobia bacterium]|jgi:CheY-like chemotaxis protein|nr:response regulator [Terriglobia bacterium]
MNRDRKPFVVLCVDDEAVGLSIRKLILESQGYSVLAAENGPDALQLFSSRRIDVVVLDYKMPGMDGGAVAQAMRTINPAVPIILLSAYVDLPQETLALVDRYLTKGEPPPVLLDTVAQLLREHRFVNSKTTSVA